MLCMGCLLINKMCNDFIFIMGFKLKVFNLIFNYCGFVKIYNINVYIYK